MIIHTVLISFKPDVPTEVKDIVTKILKNLECTQRYPYGPVAWTVQQNKDVRPRSLINGRTIDLVEYAVFNTEADFQQWRMCPEHQGAAEIMGTCADWVIGDIET